MTTSQTSSRLRHSKVAPFNRTKQHLMKIRDCFWSKNLRALLILSWLFLVGAFGASASSIEEVNASTIGAGSGVFEINLGTGARPKMISVHYYHAKEHNADDPIIIVVPGGGRNGDNYRDSWIETAEKYNLLVLSPSFTAEPYDNVAAYNLGGIIENTFRWRMFGRAKVNHKSDEWLFADLDKLFDVAVHATGSKQSGYDLFGHSAGGQIAHRLVLLAPTTKAERVVAANSGWYTIANNNFNFPYGLEKAPISQQQLTIAFERRLTVFLGERDNEDETRGSLRRTKEANAQGAHRLARGYFFFNAAQDAAAQSKSNFEWDLHVVKDVGHSYRLMGKAAGDYLYGQNN